MRRAGQLVAAAAVVAAATSAIAVAAPAARIQQLVVFRDGSARSASPTAGKVDVRVGRKRCAVPAGSALAALARSRAGRLALHDYASCSRNARDASGLFVQAIGRDRNRGQDGWVYKVGDRLATAGAGDPAGPFGHGLLGGGARVVWFYCHMNPRTHGCQATLTLIAQVTAGGRVAVSVLAHDDRGAGSPASGATVSSGGLRAQVNPDGRATLSLPRGRLRLNAEKPGAIRSADVALSVP